MTAFSAAQYNAVFATELSDVGDLSPNVELKPSTIVGLQNFTIRGMGVSGSTPSDSPTVGVFQNGVFWGSNYGAMIDTFDIEAIEILRGPQGTLFGRNVTGGAVSVRTKRPNGDFGFESEATLGTHGRADISAAVQGSLIDGVLAGRLVGSYRSFDGYFNNTLTGKPYGGADTELLRGTLVFTPTEALDVTFIGEHYNESGDSTPVRGIAVPGTLPYANGFRQPDNFWDLALDRPGPSEITVDSATLEVNLDIGPGVMTSVTGYREVTNNNNTDFDGTPFSGFNQAIAFSSEQFSQELRYAARLNSWFSFTLGAYYFELEHQFREGRNLSNNATIFASGNHVNQDSSAVFGEADISLPYNLTLTLGARYTDESITAQTRPFGGCPLPATTDINRHTDLSAPCDLGPSDTAKFNDVSPKILLSWKPDDNNLIYASATRGFRSGGFSLRGTALTPPFNSEQVTAYEVGYKGDLFDKRLRLNMALFRNTYDDLQRTIVFVSPTLGTFQKTGNAAQATIQGAELDVTWQATDKLVLTGTYGYTDAQFDSFVGLDVTGDGIPDPELASELHFVRVPANTFTLAANYDQPLASGAELKFRAAANYTGDEYLDDLNRLHEPAYTLYDASLTWVSPDARWEASVYGKNLTNEEYAFYSASLGALGLIQLVGPPRSGGVKVSFKY
ncbi:TonB-dependent receptor [soil metagenome]